MKVSTILTMIFLLLISMAHLLRLVFQVPITVNTIEIPMWMSVPACIVSAALAIWLWRDSRTDVGVRS
jgi:hypothetical protein